MNIHEYQGKEVLKKFGISVQKGIIATTVQEAELAFEQIQKDTGTQIAVVKAQIHAGGRGKGGGIKLAK